MESYSVGDVVYIHAPSIGIVDTSGTVVEVFDQRCPYKVRMENGMSIFLSGEELSLRRRFTLTEDDVRRIVREEMDREKLDAGR